MVESIYFLLWNDSCSNSQHASSAPILHPDPVTILIHGRVSFYQRFISRLANRVHDEHNTQVSSNPCLE